MSLFLPYGVFYSVFNNTNERKGLNLCLKIKFSDGLGRGRINQTDESHSAVLPELLSTTANDISINHSDIMLTQKVVVKGCTH